ncbi:hypothetical protein G4V62_02820 [Bacillaceae bacterium SIJ1]|uniref:S-layer homology domain-containing protein n=1 Tax=Litoribacterium kuwaitense TaxID=1398745 RepID=UPI0013EAC05E|nr:S-layer homology domain-containing protein [Litoribacterium kuwaitense]NGP43933.1 hypothetical protein [Litoribacterium kuwaitense]
MKKIAAMITAFLVVLAPLIPASADSGDVYQTDDVLGRGEFFNQITEQLDVEPNDEPFFWPADIDETSPYADSVKALMQRGVLEGYPGNKIQPERPLFDIEAAAILARLLHVDEDTAVADLVDTFGLSIEDGTFTTQTEVDEIFTKALVSDESALEWVNRSTEASIDVASFNASADMTMEMKFDDETMQMMEELGEEAAAMFSMDATFDMSVDLDTGIHQVITVQMPFEDPELPAEMTIEQYLVEDGIYMSIPLSESGEKEWMKIPADEAYTMPFDEMLTMQADSLEFYEQLNNEFFFYKDLGEEDGLRNIAFRGVIPSITELLEALQMQMGEEELSLEMMMPGDASVGMSGQMWIEESSAAVTRQVADMTISMDEESMGFSGMDIFFDMTMTDYNEAGPIELPEAAENAEELSFEDTMMVE